MKSKSEVPRSGYSVREIAISTGLSISGVYALMNSGKLRSVRLNGRRVIPASALAELLDEAS